MNCICSFAHFLLTIVKLHFNATTDFSAGAPGFDEVTHLIDHYFTEGVVGVSSDKSFRRPVLSETQSQSVDGTEQVTQEWMVPDQLHAYEFKKRNKMLRFENDSKLYEDKERLRRATDVAKGARYGKGKQHDLQKKNPSSVAEQGGTPRRSPRVACMDKNLGKRTVEAGAEDTQRKRPYVDDEPESDDDDFVLADVVRNAQSGRQKDSGTSKNQHKRPRVDADEDADADSGGEADVVPKVC